MAMETMLEDYAKDDQEVQIQKSHLEKIQSFSLIEKDKPGLIKYLKEANICLDEEKMQKEEFSDLRGRACRIVNA